MRLDGTTPSCPIRPNAHILRNSFHVLRSALIKLLEMVRHDDSLALEDGLEAFHQAADFGVVLIADMRGTQWVDAVHIRGVLCRQFLPEFLARRLFWGCSTSW